MTYIEPITDPKILKLGIRMALYGEPKPEKSYIIPDPINVSEAIYQTDLDKWQKSRIAYLKEPEFKVGEKVYRKKDGFKITLVKQDLKFDLKLFSHYSPGQQVESFKYVRENKDVEFLHLPSGQPISKEKAIRLECDFKDLTGEWQEVEEPEEYPKTVLKDGSEYEGQVFSSDKYTQFQADKKSGDVLAVLTK